jgi:hypothetical protein
VFIRLLEDTVNARRYPRQTEEIKWFEREAWKLMAEYLCTLEYPEWA